MELYKAIKSDYVDIKEGVIFVKAGLFYNEEVKNKYPFMFEQIDVEKAENIADVTDTVDVVEPVETVEPIVPVEPEVVEPEVVVAPVVVEAVKEVVAEVKVTNTKK